jgi:nucleoid-associated protein YgaU
MEQPADNDQDPIVEGRPPARPKWLFVLGLLFAVVGGYFALNEVDWQSTFSVPNARAPQKPVAHEARKPLPPAERAPSFDLAYVDENGKLVVAGRGETGWLVRLMTDGQALGEAKADENEEWVMIPEQPLAAGDHVLSLLEVDPVSQRSIEGQRTVSLSVAARPQSVAAAPRPAPEKGAELSAESRLAATGCDVAVVKSGDTLWQLASRCYGDGLKYPKIFESNRQQVQNPNLIFPNQQLALPH